MYPTLSIPPRCVSQPPSNTPCGTTILYIYIYADVDLCTARVEEAAGGGLLDAHRGNDRSGGEAHLGNGPDVRLPIEAHTPLRRPVQGPSQRDRLPEVSDGGVVANAGVSRIAQSQLLGFWWECCEAGLWTTASAVAVREQSVRFVVMSFLGPRQQYPFFTCGLMRFGGSERIPL